MPQVFQVLRCYKCLSFQVHQVKKSNKWECKICGEKQSVKRHYGVGTGKECRLHVQKLNEMRGAQTTEMSIYEDSDDDSENRENNKIDEKIVKTESKWSNYVEITSVISSETTENSVNDTLFGKEVVLELPKKIRKVNNKNMRNKNITHESEESEDVSNINVNNEPLTIPISNYTTTIHKNRIVHKRFVPPTNKTKCKWIEHDSENITYQSDSSISSSDLVKNNEQHNSIWVVTKTDNCLKSDKTINITNDRIGNDIRMDKSLNNTSIGVMPKRNSKWTEFVDYSECRNEIAESNSSQDFERPSKCINNASKLFSLCDDKDLDSVLDI